ncbi:MAG TPA: hypothetical protein VFU76_07775 [Terriglobales bacterium]|nr:hypothetical protein [Terriglobales bacterium]
MNTRATTQFVVFAIGNGVAAALSLAAALRGRWMETAFCVALSWACAGGILRVITTSLET